MDLPDVIDYLLSKPGVDETTPFGPDILVYKLGGKMIAATDPGKYPPRINLKCDPDRASALREEHEAILPGYHMNKKHWNTVVLNGSLPPALVRELVDHSYELVLKSLPKKKRG